MKYIKETAESISTIISATILNISNKMMIPPDGELFAEWENTVVAIPEYNRNNRISLKTG